MKITALRTTAFRIPLARAIGFAHGAMADTRNVLIEVETDAGLTGIAEAPSRPFIYGESQASIVAAVRDWFAPALVGTDPFDTGALWQRLDKVQNNLTAKGAIDLALHDLMGKALGLSCRRLLGGGGDVYRPRATYVCGYSSPGEMVEEVQAVNAAYGIDAFKIKIGVEASRDAETLRLIRDALPDATLYVDGNEAFDRFRAIEVLALCADVGVVWAEEPCHHDDRAARASVGRSGAVPILGDESCRTPQEVAREIDDGCIHMVSIKVARTGYVRSRDILGLCRAHAIRPMVGSQGDSGIGVMAAGHFCAAFEETRALPAELSFHLNLAADVLTDPPRIEAGRLCLPDGPGMGVEIDRTKLKELTVE